MLRKSFAFVAALTMASAPVLAQPSAAPLSVARAGAVTEDGSELRSGSWFPALVALTIIILGALTAAGVIFDDDDPDSP